MSREQKVSIPFKRDRYSEHMFVAYAAAEADSVSIPFKRDRYSELSHVNFSRGAVRVSIPFKRDRYSELDST